MGCIVLVRRVLVLRCGSAGVVWCGIRMQAEALLVCLCGMWGLGVNDRSEKGVYFSRYV